MINISNISNEVFKILKGNGYNIKLYTDEGESTVDPDNARRFYIPKLGSMVNLDETESTRELRVSVNQNTNLDEFKDTLYQLKNLANRNIIEYTLKSFTKHIEPKDQDYQAQKVRDMKIDEGISPAYGTSKSSYQKLESAKLIIKHTKPVNEESRGSRSRNISAIYIENADGERYKMPTNNLAGGRAMLRHVKEGGNPHDEFGQHIQEQTVELKKLKEFANYSKRNGLVNEDTADIVEAVSQRIASIRESIGKLKGCKCYHETKEKFEAKEPVNEAPFPGEFDYTNSPQEDEEIKAIMMKHPEEAKKLKATGDIDSGSDLYMDLFSYYLDSGEMPYGTAKARDGDPVEWILDRLDDMGMPMGNLESVEQDKLRNQFTVRTFDESLNDALPYVNALVKEMKAIREADEFTKQTMDSLVATIDKMDSVKLRKGIDVKSDPENPMNFSSFGNMPKENQIATVLEYLGNSIEFSKSQDQLVTLLTRMSDEMERVKDKPMMIKIIGAIKTLMPKLTTTASEGTDIKKVSVGNYMERKLSNYEFDKLFG